MEGEDGGGAAAGQEVALGSRAAAAATVGELLQDGEEAGWVRSWGRGTVLILTGTRDGLNP